MDLDANLQRALDSMLRRHVRVQFRRLECSNDGDVTGIDLTEQSLQGTISSEIGKLTALTSLFLDGNRLFGTIPTHVGNLKALQAIYLSNNQLEGTIPSEISKLEELRLL
jgi:Leucine-rich repeat (LRR) protein